MSVPSVDGIKFSSKCYSPSSHRTYHENSPVPSSYITFSSFNVSICLKIIYTNKLVSLQPPFWSFSDNMATDFELWPFKWELPNMIYSAIYVKHTEAWGTSIELYHKSTLSQKNLLCVKLCISLYCINGSIEGKHITLKNSNNTLLAMKPELRTEEFL